MAGFCDDEEILGPIIAVNFFMSFMYISEELLSTLMLSLKVLMPLFLYSDSDVKSKLGEERNYGSKYGALTGQIYV
jgi:hypothetical protein